MKRIGWSNIWKPHNTSDREYSRNRFNNMKQCNVTNREFHLALQWSTKSNVILTRTLPYSSNNYSDNLDNENGSKRLIRMRSVPRVVALQRAVAINKGPMMIKLMTILTITTNKSLKINWFAIRTKGGAKAGQYQMMKIKLMTNRK